MAPDWRAAGAVRDAAAADVAAAQPRDDDSAVDEASLGFRVQAALLGGRSLELWVERLQLVAEKLTPEPFVHDPNEDDATRMERALQRVLEQMGDIGVMQRAAAGERLASSEQETFDRLAQFLRGELVGSMRNCHPKAEPAHTVDRAIALQLLTRSLIGRGSGG